MLVESKDLNRLLYNALLFSPTDSLSQGTAEFGCDYETELFVLASDNYVIMTDAIDVEDAEVGGFSLRRESMRALEKKTRDLDATVALTLKSQTCLMVAWDTESMEIHLPVREVNLWMDYYNILQKFEPEKTGWPFAISPERMGKICRLKTGGDYPVDFAHGSSFQDFLVGFKVGPRTRGVISPLQRENLDQGGLW